MSWAFDGVGKPDALKRAIQTQVSSYNGQSRTEFERAQTALNALLDMSWERSIVELHANGHETIDANTNKRTYAQVSVTLKQLGNLCE